jgi:DNA repair protein RadC
MLEKHMKNMLKLSMESKKMSNKQKPIHSGHRERLTELVSNVGVENISDIQVVEFFLTYIFPRGDVNPLAHRLLDKFESFANIINAEISDLETVKGINKRSASKIKMFSSLFDAYTYSSFSNKINIKNIGQFLDMLESLLRLQPSENLYLFAIDHSFNVTQKRKYNLQNVREVGITPFELFNFISSTKLSYLIVAHNHPSGTALASKNDHEAVSYIEQLIQTFGVRLLDSFIVGKDGIYSEKQQSFVRTFESVEKTIEKIVDALN